MFSGKDMHNPAYPTQWALNPTAYQNVDASQVDWAALAQQWIAMKESSPIVPPPPPPKIEKRIDIEEGEAPMEVETVEGTDHIPDVHHDVSSSDWESTGNSWGSSWNQWGWGWSGGADQKVPVESPVPTPPASTYSAQPDNVSAIPGYTSGGVPPPTFQHGYWTAPQVEQTNNRGNSMSNEHGSKNRIREKPPRVLRPQRDKIPMIPTVIEPVVPPTHLQTSTIDAAKRRQLPAWIREGLEKMEREKQRAIEREHEKRIQEEAEKEKKRLEEQELERLKNEAGGQPMLPPKSKFESDSEPEDAMKEENDTQTESTEIKEEPSEVPEKEDEPFEPTIPKKSREEIMQEIMLSVRRSLTEILLEVTDQEILTVSQEELARYSTAQASRLNAMKASKSRALAAITSGLGLGAYDSSSEESGAEDEPKDLSDQQLQDLIRRKRIEFERTSREIEADVRRVEQKEASEEAAAFDSETPERPKFSRSSETPPPVDRETPEKAQDRTLSKSRKSDLKYLEQENGSRILESIPEENSRKSNKRQHTPSPPSSANNRTNYKQSSSSSSDSEEDSSSSSSGSLSDSDSPNVEVETKKRRRKSTSSGESKRKALKSKSSSRKLDDRIYSKSRRHSDYEKDRVKSKKREDYYEKQKSSKSSYYEKSHKGKYGDDSDEERHRKRSRRSRSYSDESRSGRKKFSRDRSRERSRRKEKKSYDRESSKGDRTYDRSSRDYDKYDKYERSRDRRRSHSASRSRHRR